jgi:Domain of unknown function (DUF3597)
MKVLDLDSSLSARKQLAQELHYAGDTNDSAAMNMWLHKQVMTKLAETAAKCLTTSSISRDRKTSHLQRSPMSDDPKKKALGVSPKELKAAVRWEPALATLGDPLVRRKLLDSGPG